MPTQPSVGRALPTPMALTNAQRQARHKAKRDALARSHPEVIEAALLREAERPDLSDAERAEVADKLGDMAMRHLRRSQELGAIARRLRPSGWLPPGLPRGMDRAT
jgi:hypothetical protein